MDMHWTYRSAVMCLGRLRWSAVWQIQTRGSAETAMRNLATIVTSRCKNKAGCPAYVPRDFVLSKKMSLFRCCRSLAMSNMTHPPTLIRPLPVPRILAHMRGGDSRSHSRLSLDKIFCLMYFAETSKVKRHSQMSNVMAPTQTSPRCPTLYADINT
jgi:hypothetical protein